MHDPEGGYNMPFLSFFLPRLSLSAAPSRETRNIIFTVEDFYSIVSYWLSRCLIIVKISCRDSRRTAFLGLLSYKNSTNRLINYLDSRFLRVLSAKSSELNKLKLDGIEYQFIMKKSNTYQYKDQSHKHNFFRSDTTNFPCINFT